MSRLWIRFFDYALLNHSKSIFKENPECSGQIDFDEPIFTFHPHAMSLWRLTGNLYSIFMNIRWRRWRIFLNSSKKRFN